jgi:predicted outer membrane protein
MIRDHSAAKRELLAIAAEKNNPIPDSLLPRHQRRMDRPIGLVGTAFYRTDKDMMAEARKDDVDKLEDASRKAKDAEVKQLMVLALRRATARSIHSAL